MNIHGGLNVYSEQANIHAEKMYNEIRQRRLDYINVAKNTGFSIEQAQIIKNYIFKDWHMINDKLMRFSPSYEMAESWRRLSQRKGAIIYEHDILLLWHELTEIDLLIRNSNWTQQKAHTVASSTYNYKEASDKFYKSRGQL